MIEVIARGILTRANRVLLCRSLFGGYVYLPGGHVEFGEPARAALVREVEEELGASLEAGEFLGLLEHVFRDAGGAHAELNVLFRLCGEVGDLRSREQEIAFLWAPLSELGSLPLLPQALVSLLPRWLEDPSSNRFASSVAA
jgi:8-oxo-dGTP diphosphatase